MWFLRSAADCRDHCFTACFELVQKHPNYTVSFQYVLPCCTELKMLMHVL